MDAAAIKSNSIHGKINFSKYLFFVPSVLLMLGFFVVPVFYTLYMSFTNSALTGTSSTQFVGLSNYISMFQDTTVWTSMVNTIVFLVGSSLIGQQVIGFLVAYMMKNKNSSFRRVIGALILIGWILPEIIVAFCMITFLAKGGTLNSIAGVLGAKPVEWAFTHPMLSIIIANAWHGTAFSMMIFQAALDDVPGDIEEACIVDGANSFQVLTHITIPYIKGTISTNMMLNTLQTLGVFGLIFTMTGGGPGTKSTTLPIFMYRTAFVNYQLGYGTAISMILLLIGVLLSIFYVKAMKV